MEKSGKWQHATTQYKDHALGTWRLVNFIVQEEVLQIAQLLSLLIYVSVSLMRVNLRELRENLKHKIQTQNW